MNVWHCLESDVVTNPQDHPRFQAVFVGRTPSVTALALRDVVVAFCPMEDSSTTSSSATRLLLFKVCVNRRKSRLELGTTPLVLQAFDGLFESADAICQDLDVMTQFLELGPGFGGRARSFEVPTHFLRHLRDFFGWIVQPCGMQVVDGYSQVVHAAFQVLLRRCPGFSLSTFVHFTSFTFCLAGVFPGRRVRAFGFGASHELVDFGLQLLGLIG